MFFGNEAERLREGSLMAFVDEKGFAYNKSVPSRRHSRGMPLRSLVLSWTMSDKET